MIYVSGRIIGPFHKTVKIWLSHLDIQPGDYQIFVKIRIIGYNPRDFTINQISHNIAMKVGRTVRWDDAKEEIIGDRDASKLPAKEYRAPWDRESKDVLPKV